MSDLYIMQNHLGFIKVGRSINVAVRRRALERSDQCTIALVAVIRDAGGNEDAMLHNLSAHHVIGEWFEGDELARDGIAMEVDAMSKVLGRVSPELQWPYPLASEADADEWLERYGYQRTVVRIDKEYSSQISRMLRGVDDPHDFPRSSDMNLWTLLWRFERQANTIVINEKRRGKEVLVGYTSEHVGGDIVPHYTSDVSAALLLWPEQDRPIRWDGSAWDCCVAALKARKQRLAKHGLTSLTATDCSAVKER